MTRNKIRQRLVEAFPFREASQPRGSDLALPGVYGELSVSGAQNASVAGSTSGVAQVLQSTLKEASDALTQSNKQVADLLTAQQQLLASTNQNTQALNSNTAIKSATGTSALSTLGNVAGGILGGGSILGPIANELIGLFRNTSVAQPFLTPYIAPSAVQLETTLNAGSTAPIPESPAQPSSAGSNAGSSGAQVQIQVNAIDSRSFLDHSDAIAEAVRQALLNSHSLGDVIAEL